MSRREQPYIPLYAQDFLTDEKLRECSASSVGVYIMLMCVMHKQEEYGTIILRQKDRQGGDIIDDFAAKLAKHLPFNVSVIGNALRELLDEDVIQMDGDRLLQKRMVRDADISKKRSVAGRKGSTAVLEKARSPPIPNLPQQSRRQIPRQTVWQNRRKSRLMRNRRATMTARKVSTRKSPHFTTKSVCHSHDLLNYQRREKKQLGRGWQADTHWRVLETFSKRRKSATF